MLSVLRSDPALADLHTFTYDASKLTPPPKKVYLAGSFNGWNPIGQEMLPAEGKPGFWTLTVDLPQGVHFYKFVADGSRWQTDPASDKELEESDGNGGMNSALLVGPDARKAPAPTPNHINGSLLIHQPKDPSDADNAGKGLLRLRARAQKDDVQKMYAVVGLKPYPLYRTGSELGLDVFTGMVSMGQNTQYYILAEDGTATGIIGAAGSFANEAAINAEKSDDRDFTVPPVRLETPDWSKHAVWYQIFPERFRNGDSSNDPGGKSDQHLIRWTSNWWESQPGETPGPENFYRGTGNVWARRYGGDIQGIREKLPYLRSLGITAIYLNPIFEASSMHKYDTRDYRHVDHNLTIKEELPLPGETDDPATWKWSKGDLLFLDFVQEAHKQGFKVVLDGVFNHVGRDHPFFQDVVQKGKASKYVDWFDIESFPESLPAKESEFGQPGGLNFKAWDKASGHLPILKKTVKTGLAKGPYEHVMAITKRWLAPDGDPSKGIDGWRLDVANDIPHVFWEDWRKVVKGAKADAYISGEIWQPAQPWLKGGEFDAVMNYQFAMPAQRFFVNQKEATTPTAFARDMNKLVGMYPLQASLSMMNLYDSHDTDRLASMFVNPDRPYDGANRIQDSDPHYSPAPPSPEQWQRFKQAVAFQMFFLGSPMVYYGDEAGMYSPDDPSNRQPFVWPDLGKFDDPNVRFNEDIFAHYQRCIAIRQALPALQTGYLRTVQANDNRRTLVLARDLGGQTVYLAVNRSDQPQVVTLDNLSGAWVDYAAPDNGAVSTSAERPQFTLKPSAKDLPLAEGHLKLTLPPYATAVLVPRNTSPQVTSDH